MSRFRAINELAALLPPTTVPEDIARIESSLLPSLLCHHAAVGDGKALAALVAAGADPTCADYDGRTALHLAAAEVPFFFLTLYSIMGPDLICPL